MAITTAKLEITWEKLPDDFILPDDPVDNINQPLLAAALSESLEVAGKLPEKALTCTNYGICATVNGKTVVKAPDWAYIPQITVSREEVFRSYTPKLQGDMPELVMEFLSDTGTEEYSTKPTYPPGKWFFYEQVLQVPNYGIFDLQTSILELYRLDNGGRYQLQPPNPDGRYWIPEMSLFLGIWQGKRQNRQGYWLTLFHHFRKKRSLKGLPEHDFGDLSSKLDFLIGNKEVIAYCQRVLALRNYKSFPRLTKEE